MKRLILSAALISSLVACVSAPTGPTIAVMPREGKPFEVFQQEDQQCRGFASNAIKDSSNAALKDAATSAAVAAALLLSLLHCAALLMFEFLPNVCLAFSWSSLHLFLVVLCSACSAVASRRSCPWILRWGGWLLL